MIGPQTLGPTDVLEIPVGVHQFSCPGVEGIHGVMRSMAGKPRCCFLEPRWTGRGNIHTSRRRAPSISPHVVFNAGSLLRIPPEGHCPQEVAFVGDMDGWF